MMSKICNKCGAISTQRVGMINAICLKCGSEDLNDGMNIQQPVQKKAVVVPKQTKKKGKAK